jgi:hypothetical protein
MRFGAERVPVLIEHGLAQGEVAGKRLRQHELKELFINHFLLVADIRAKLLIEAKTGPVKLRKGRLCGTKCRSQMARARSDTPCSSGRLVYAATDEAAGREEQASPFS